MSRYLLIFFLILALASCDSLFFYPIKEQLVNPDEIGIAYEVHKIDDGKGPVLHGWLLKSKKQAKGTILHLHGNAENISTHVGSVYWLPEYGYNVFIFDYRGYGASDGITTLEGVQEDAVRAAKYVSNLQEIKGVPVYLFGQSIGAAVSIYLAARPEMKGYFKAVIVESPFAGYRKIARDKLRSLWLTYIFSYPLSFTVSSAYDPIDVVDRISPTPLLIVYTSKDRIIDPYHSKELFEKAVEPKQIWEIPELDHIQTFQLQKNKMRLLQYLSTNF